MLPGDLIVSIDGLGVSGKNASELVKLMRGPAGTQVRVSVRRQDREELIKFTLSRQVIEVSSVLGADLAGKIAYLRIKQFQSKTDTELLQAVADLRKRMGNISGVLLDLRNNPGGLVAAATSVADEFLPSGVVYSTRHRGSVVDQVQAGSSGALQDCPMVVLVNEFSASASELLAGALQDHKRATIIGARTFGKGSVQSIIDLPGGGGLRLTTMRYYTPGGRAIQVEGIVPDVAVDSSLADGGNPVLREHDLENHLPSEGRASEAQPAATPAASPPIAPTATPEKTAEPAAEGEKPGLSPTHLGVARSIPHDPSGGPDHALSVAYAHLRTLLAGGPSERGGR
jgi:carboxyl-terminal processing protease